jgi:hypothetical protein
VRIATSVGDATHPLRRPGTSRPAEAETDLRGTRRYRREHRRAESETGPRRTRRYRREHRRAEARARARSRLVKTASMVVIAALAMTGLAAASSDHVTVGNGHVRKVKPPRPGIAIGRPGNPTPTPSATPGSATTPTAESQTSTPSPTVTETSSPTNSNTPSSSPLPSSTSTPVATNTGFPDASNTGVPAGTALSAYTGPCTITAANTVIDAKSVSCGLEIRASGVKITRSKLGNGITVGSSGTVNISDSEIIASPDSTSVGEVNFTVERSNIWGGNRGVNCYDNCTVRDSYIHGIRYTGDTHASGMRAGQRTTYEHNTIWCDAQTNSYDGGCSADLTMYGDFTTVQYVTIRNNLFKATPGGVCAYGGSTKSKPYPNAHHIVYDGNVFERGTNGKCGYYGAVTDFSSSSTGNQWTNNVWDDGTVAKPSLG